MKLQYEYRDSHSSDNLEFLPARWQRIMENVSDDQVDCMIDPSHLLQLTVEFFEREFESEQSRKLSLTASNSTQADERDQTPSAQSIPRTESPILELMGAFESAQKIKLPQGISLFSPPVEPLKSLSSTYKISPPVSESLRLKMERIIEADSDLKLFQGFIPWLRNQFSSEIFVNVESPESETAFVYQTTR